MAAAAAAAAAATAAHEEKLSSLLWKHQLRLTVGLIKQFTLASDDASSSFHTDHKNILLSPHFLVSTLSSLMCGSGKDTRIQLACTLLCHKINGKSDANDFISAHYCHNHSMLKKNRRSLRVDTFLYRDLRSLIKLRQEKLWKKYECIAKELILMNDSKPSLNSLETINQDFLESDDHKQMLSPEDYVSLVSDSIETVLVNSVHFKSLWSKEFELQNGEFRKPNGESVCTEMLYKKKSFRYFEDHHTMSKAIKINFAHDGRVSMVLILPQENISLHHYVKHLLDYDVLKRILKNLTGRYEVRLTLPKFAFKVKANMTNALQRISSFVPNDKNEKIEKICSLDEKMVLVQRLAIEVDEKGAESNHQPGLMSKFVAHKEAELKADRPFLFLIMTNGDHKQILFAGLCNDPTQ